MQMLIFILLSRYDAIQLVHGLKDNSAGNVGIASTRGALYHAQRTCVCHCKNTPRITVDAVMTARLNPFKSVELLS